MDLRSLIFNVSFKGDTKGISQMDSAADSLKDNMEGAASGTKDLTKEMGGAAKEAKGATSETKDLSSNIDSATSSTKDLDNHMGEAADSTKSAAGEASTMENELKKIEQTNAGNEVARQMDLASSSTSGAIDKIEGIGKSMGKVGGGMTKAITTPVVAAGAATIKTVADFDDTMSQVKGIGNLNGDQFDTIREKAKDIGISTKFSASEAADAFTYMAMAGWDADQMYESIDGTMELAAASGEDLALVTDIVTDSMTAFGMGAGETSDYADLLASASSNSNTNVAMLGESFKYIAPLAGALGHSAEDTTMALGLMANAGIKGSQAGTSYKTALTNMIKPSDAMASAMNYYGISATNANGEMKSGAEIIDHLRDKLGGLSEAEQGAAAATIFGKESMAGMLAIINAAPEDYDKLSDATRNYAGEAKRMADENENNIGGAFRSLKSAIEGLAIEFGDVFKDDVKMVAEMVIKLVRAFADLPAPMKKTIGIVALVAAAIGPMLLVGSKAIGMFVGLHKNMQKLKDMGSVASLFSKTTGAMKGTEIAAAGAGKGLLATMGPILLVVGALAVLGFAIKKLWDENEDFKNGILKIWGIIKDNLQKIMKTLKSFWDKYGKSIMNTISDIVLSIAKVLQGIVEFVAGVLTGDWELAWDGICNIFGGVWDTITKLVETGIKIWQVAISGFWDWCTSLFKAAGPRVVDILSNAWEGIKDIVVDVFTFIKDYIKDTWNDLWSETGTVWDAIKLILIAAFAFIGFGFAIMAAKAIASTTVMAVQTIAQFVRMTIATGIETAIMVGKTIAQFVFMAIETVAQTLIMAGGVALQFITMSAQAIAQAVVMVATVIAKFVMMSAQAIIQTGIMVAGVISSFITMAAPVLLSAATMAAGVIASFAGMVASAVSAGIAFVAAFWPFILIAAAVVAAGVLIYKNWDTIKEKAGQLASWISEKWNAIATSISGAWDRVKTKTSEVWNSIMTSVKGFAGKMLGAGKDIVRGLINGIGSMFGALKNKMAGLAKSAMSAFKSVLGIKSPSRKFGEYGVNTVEGYTNAIDDESKGAMDTMGDLASGISDSFNDSMDLDGSGTSLGKMGEIANNVGKELEKTYETTVDVNFNYDDMPSFNREGSVAYSASNNVIPVDFVKGEREDKPKPTDGGPFPVVDSNSGGGTPSVSFRPEINITISGTADESTVEALRAEMAKEMDAQMEAFFKKLNMKIS